MRYKFYLFLSPTKLEKLCHWTSNIKSITSITLAISSLNSLKASTGKRSESTFFKLTSLRRSWSCLEKAKTFPFISEKTLHTNTLFLKRKKTLIEHHTNG